MISGPTQAKNLKIFEHPALPDRSAVRINTKNSRNEHRINRMKMDRPTFSVIFLTILGCCAGAEQLSPLFDGKSLSGWYAYIKEEGKIIGSTEIFTIEDGCIKISGKKPGYLSTEKEYADFELTFSYRWADTQSITATRNSGLIYHAIGEDRMWCNGMEFQMQQGDAGDLWLIPGSQPNASIKVEGKSFGGVAKGTRVVKTDTNEKALGEWNEMKLICRGNNFEHWVNGKKVLSGETLDRNKGKIQFQSEGHEVWIRNIQLTDLSGTR